MDDSESSRVLFLITARSGSKGVPRKNLRKIAGISLVGFKAIAARRSKHCTRLIISTDSPEIQQDARIYGVDVPFTRPAELATDTASSLDVINHAITWIENETNEVYDAIMLLEPSSPFATNLDFDQAVELMKQNQANVVVGVRPVEVHSSKVGPLDEQSRIRRPFDQLRPGHTRRQDDQQEYTLNGALYLFKWDFFKQHRKIMADPETTYAYVMRRAYSIEIDEMIDLAWAEFLVEKGHVDLKYWPGPVFPSIDKSGEAKYGENG